MNRYTKFFYRIAIIIFFSFISQMNVASVEAGWPDLTFPSDEGITLQKGNTYTILWNSVNTDPVDILLCEEVEPSYIDCFYDIARNVPNNGQYSWTVPTSLSNGSNYVISVGKVPVSAASSDFAFTISDHLQTPLLPPTLSYTIDGVNLSVSWTPVSGATGYTFHYAPFPYTGPESIAEIDMGTQTTLSADLWEGASFLVAVQSYNDQDVSNYSDIETITIPYTTAPESPQLSYNLDGTNLTATWGSVPNATGYKLYYTLSAYTGQEAFLPVDVGNQTSFSYTGLSEGQTYSIAVVAYNDFGESDFSNIAQFTVEDTPSNPQSIFGTWVGTNGLKIIITDFLQSKDGSDFYAGTVYLPSLTNAGPRQFKFTFSNLPSGNGIVVQKTSDNKINILVVFLDGWDDPSGSSSILLIQSEFIPYENFYQNLQDGYFSAYMSYESETDTYGQERYAKRVDFYRE